MLALVAIESRRAATGGPDVGRAGARKGLPRDPGARWSLSKTIHCAAGGCAWAESSRSRTWFPIVIQVSTTTLSPRNRARPELAVFALAIAVLARGARASPS